jgi:hypothetical protein
MVGLFMHSLFKLGVSPISLLTIAWLTCMQNVGALRMLGEFQQDAISLGLP